MTRQSQHGSGLDVGLSRSARAGAQAVALRPSGPDNLRDVLAEIATGRDKDTGLVFCLKCGELGVGTGYSATLIWKTCIGCGHGWSEPFDGEDQC